MIFFANDSLPFAQICMDATGSQAATTIFLLIPVLLFVNSVRGIVITAARVLLSLGRDKVMPRAEMWTHTFRGEPIYGVVLSVLVPLLCGAVQLGPSSAFNSLLGGAVIVFELSYGELSRRFRLKYSYTSSTYASGWKGEAQQGIPTPNFKSWSMGYTL